MACIIYSNYQNHLKWHQGQWHCDSDAENCRSPCFDWLNFIWTGIKYEILLHILLFQFIWTGIIFQIIDFDLIVQNDFSITVVTLVVTLISKILDFVTAVSIDVSVFFTNTFWFLRQPQFLLMTSRLFILSSSCSSWNWWMTLALSAIQIDQINDPLGLIHVECS